MSPLDVDVVVVMDHARSTLVQPWDSLSVAAATKIASYQTRAISSKIIHTYPIKDVHPPKVVLQALSSGVASVAISCVFETILDQSPVFTVRLSNLLGHR